MPRGWGRPVVVLAAVVLAGCGDAPVGQVTGKVTRAGAAVPDADLVFQPADDPDGRYTGVSGADGAYVVSYRTFKGMPVGRYRVTVTRSFLRGGKALPEGEAGQAVKNSGKALTETYSFEKDVVAGPNSIDFELTQGTRVKE